MAESVKESEQSNNCVYPEGLINWMGNREGGVRIPFQKSSGRPSGEQIETPLVSKLNRWAAAIAKGEEVPRNIILVGGPGNGKTDTIEGCIESLDSEMAAEGKLLGAFEKKFITEGEDLAPRRVDVEIKKLGLKKPPENLGSIILVQDATANDPVAGKSAASLLYEELEALLNADSKDIYLCCVNRGILSQAVAIASGQNSKAQKLVSLMTKAVTSSAEPPSCWPLDGYPQIGIWPMDVESLVFTPAGNVKTVAHQIISAAVDKEKWPEPCESGRRCPFCQNRKLLEKSSNQDGLVSILHYYELSSGKRWTFRDLFSLIPYIIVGDLNEFEIKGKRFSPCEWSAQQLKIANEGPAGSRERVLAPFLLASRLYYHRLFPVWPSFNKGDFLKAKRELLKSGQKDEGLQAGADLFKFFAASGKLSRISGGEIMERVCDSLCPNLDPGNITGEQVLIERNGEGITIADIESDFSLSVKDGLEGVKFQVDQLERDILKLVAKADESLTEDKFPRNHSRKCRLLQITVRQFSSRLVKRSLGTRLGICSDSIHFKGYINKVMNGDDGLSEVRKAMKLLIHESNSFKANLATTFGQPMAERSREISLIIERTINPKPCSSELTCESRPKESFSFLRIEGHFVPVTFQLYKALRNIKDGLLQASLPNEIFSMLDLIKALVSGKVVRDKDFLQEDAKIVVGRNKEKISFSNGKFYFLK